MLRDFFDYLREHVPITSPVVFVGVTLLIVGYVAFIAVSKRRRDQGRPRRMMGRARRPEGAWARGPRGVVSRVLTAVALLAPSALADTPTSESGTSVGTRAESGASFAESPELPVVAAKTEAKPPPPSPPGRNGPACEPSFAARIYRETRNKVVVVERPEGGLGAGFVFVQKLL